MFGVIAPPLNASVRAPMTRFAIRPDSFIIPSLTDLHAQWVLIPDDGVRSAILTELQYLKFHRYLLDSLHMTTKRNGALVEGKIDLSVRAGAIKAAALLMASIAEAALRCHAEHRGYNLPRNPRHRTLGQVLSAWDEAGRNEVASIWDDLHTLQDHRNRIHLYKAAEESHDWREVLEAEAEVLRAGDRVLEVLSTIRAP